MTNAQASRQERAAVTPDTSVKDREAAYEPAAQAGVSGERRNPRSRCESGPVRHFPTNTTTMTNTPPPPTHQETNAALDDYNCPECKSGTLEYPPVENCSCHICPPCSRCVDNRLTCIECGWEEPEPEPSPSPTQARTDRVDKYLADFKAAKQRGHTFPHGGRIFNINYDGRSGSTMVFTGQYEGEVTAADIYAYLGDGTFGHRGPFLQGGRFTYTKITD